jgi:hypothetical protein
MKVLHDPPGQLVRGQVQRDKSISSFEALRREIHAASAYVKNSLSPNTNVRFFVTYGTFSVTYAVI